MTYLPLKVRAKIALKKMLPASAFGLILSGWRATFSKLSSKSDINIITRYTEEFLAQYGTNVVGGPFNGMRYIDRAAGSGYLTKLVGFYEEILHDEMESYKKRNFKTIIDIGCAEGYYLIGIGRSSPSSELIGYDIDENALNLTQELYNINNLQNKLILKKDCTSTNLESAITDKTLIICDAEGFEEEILNPIKTPALREVQTMLVELHDFVVPHIKEILVKRFITTHDIKTIVFAHADKNKYPFLQSIHNKKDIYTILRERGEQEQEWLVFEKK